MSTVTAVKKNGYIAIAADTLVSVGPMKMTTTYNKTCRKILRVGDSYLGMTGWMVGVQVLDSLFRLAAAPPADFDAATAAPIESHLIRLAPAAVEEFDLPLHV